MPCLSILVKPEVLASWVDHWKMQRCYLVPGMLKGLNLGFCIFLLHPSQVVAEANSFIGKIHHLICLNFSGGTAQGMDALAHELGRPDDEMNCESLELKRVGVNAARCIFFLNQNLGIVR